MPPEVERRPVVRGTIWSETAGKRIVHAWYERGDFVVDLALPLNSRIVMKERYYGRGQPVVRKMYSAEEAIEMSVKHRHDGPWNQT